MRANADMTFERRTAEVETFACRLCSNLTRSVYRHRRAAIWRDYHGGRRPRYDSEIVVAWTKRRLAGMGYVVRLPKLGYEADPRGPGATQWASLDILIPSTEFELELFDGLRLPDSFGRIFHYMEVNRFDAALD